MKSKLFLISLMSMISAFASGQNIQQCKLDLTGYPMSKLSQQTVTPHNGKYLRANGEFKTLVVFISFQTDPTNVPDWPQGQDPENLNTILSSSPTNIPSNKESLSHFFNVNSGSEFKQNGGEFKVYGDAVHVTLPYSSTAHSYQTDIRNGLIAADNLVDYSDYDNRDNSINDLSDGSDGIVDKIIVVVRGKYLGGAQGWNALRYSGSTLNLDGVTLSNNGPGGSGVSVAWPDNFSKNQILGIIVHEIGHHILSITHPHANGYVSNNYKKWSLLYQSLEKKDGFSVNAFESWILGWSSPTIITSDDQIDLDDFLTSGESVLYKLPGKDYEFYGIENRQKLNIYDDATVNSNDKGIFITHYNIEDYYNSTFLVGYSPAIRVYTSDGRYDWDYYQDVPSHWDPNQYIPAFEKVAPEPITGGDVFSMHYKPSSLSWNHLYAIKQPNGQVIGSDYFQGEDVVVTYNKNSKPLFASITNPAPSDWSGTPTDFAVKVLNQNGSKIDLKVFTNYDPYTITEHTTWDGQIFLEESVTIQSGAKLTIKPGTIVYLDEGVSINVSGELHASSTIFTAMDTNWGRINFNSGSEGFLNKVTIEKAKSYGGAAVYISNAGSNPIQILESTIKDCAGACGGVYVTNSANVYVYDTLIENNTSDGIVAYNSSVRVLNSFIDLNSGQTGVLSNSSSNVLFSAVTSGFYAGKNTIVNGKFGLRAGYQATLVAGNSPTFASQNRIANQSGSGWAHINHYSSGASIYAQYNYFKPYNGSGGVAPTITGSGGSVVYSPWLTNDPDPGAGFKQAFTTAEEQEQIVQAIQLNYEGNHKEAARLLSELIEYADDEKIRRQGLIQYGWIARLSGDKNYSDYLHSLTQKFESGDLGATLRSVLATVYFSREKTDKALEKLDEITNRYQGTEHAFQAMVLAAHVAEESGNRTQAVRYFQDASALSASQENERLLSDLQFYLNSKSLSGTKEIFSDESALKPENPGLVLSNYPNPFNPVTNIVFTLPVKSQVSLAVYDMLGREVAVLVHEELPAGEQTIRFDASNLANGMYLYKLRANNQELVQKMTLIK